MRTVHARHQGPVAIPNRLNQQFAVWAKNRVWADAWWMAWQRWHTNKRKNSAVGPVVDCQTTFLLSGWTESA
ncbi:MAG: hypothetical protein JNN16_12280 [Nitrospira sp.]|nr:hypothetical protein [Nitrospira sp.]